MSYLTTEERALTRSQKQNTKLYLSIYQPSTVLACRVNDASIAKGERSITYNTVSEGNFLGVTPGMTLMVGSSAGSDDKGRVRVRSANATTLSIAENSHINWSDGDFLTVINYFEINVVYQRIIQDPSNELNTIWYKDYDIEHTNQNNILGTMICMGSHYAGFLDVTGTHQVFYSASGTHNMFDESLAYQWIFEGADTTGSVSETPGWVTYSNPGHYTTTLIVSGTVNGAVDKSYRHVSIYDRPENGTNNPILNWEMGQFSGDRNKGGYTGKIKIRETIDSSILKAGSLVVIFAESYYDNNKKILGGNALNRGNIFFVGYIMEGTIIHNYRQSFVEFEVGSPVELMKIADAHAIDVEDSTDPASQSAAQPEDYPSGWVLLKNMNFERALYHYLRWHTTALNCMDFQYLGSDIPVQYFRPDLSSMYDAMKTWMNNANWGTVTNDRQGKIWFETPVWFSEDASYFATNMEITSQDWMGDPRINESFVNELAFLESGGIAWSSAATGTFGAFLCGTPGTAPAYRGKTEKKPSLAITGQAQLNTLSGDYFAHANATYKDVFLGLRGFYPQYDIAPQEIVPLTVDADRTVRGVGFSGKSFYPQTVSYVYDPNAEFLYPQISFYEQTSGFSGDTIIKPPVPTSSETGGDYGVPTFEIPPLPVIEIPDFTSGAGIERLWVDHVDPARNVSTATDVYRDTASPGPDPYTSVPNGEAIWFNYNFLVPLGATSFLMYIVSRNGTSSGSGTLYMEYIKKSVSIGTPGTTKGGFAAAASQAVSSSTAGLYYFTPVTFTMGSGPTDIAAGDYVNMEIRVDRSSDPPDTFSGSWRHVGLYIIFSY